jgi:hypothetical protein
MGTVFNRGTKEKPNWYVGYRENGKWKYRPSDQPTKALAKRFVQEIEGRIARGQVGIEEPASAPLCGALIEQFLEGLANRNADDDRSRGAGTSCRSSASCGSPRSRSRPSWSGSTSSAPPAR